MRLTRTDVVVGMSANDARELMRRFRSARPESAISGFVDTGERSDHQIARALHEAGYLRVKWDDLDGETWWETTTKGLSLIHISEPTRRTPISYAVFCLKKKKKK